MIKVKGAETRRQSWIILVGLMASGFTYREEGGRGLRARAGRRGKGSGGRGEGGLCQGVGASLEAEKAGGGHPPEPLERASPADTLMGPGESHLRLGPQCVASQVCVVLRHKVCQDVLLQLQEMHTSPSEPLPV